MARTGSTTSTTRRSRSKSAPEAEVEATEITNETTEAVPAEGTTTAEAQEANEMSTDTVEAPVEETAQASDTTEVDAAANQEAQEADNKFTEFQSAVDTALNSKDETTGTVPDVNLEAVKAAYRELPGAKYKGKAKTFLNDKLKQIVNAHDIILAQAAMACIDAIEHAGPAARKETERKPADPAEAYRDKVTVLHLAYALARGDVPEGVDGDEQIALVEAKVGELTDAAQAYYTWTQSTAEDKGDEPEVDAVVKRAVKAAQGKAATVARSRSASTGGAPRSHSGANRNVRTHIAQAFGDQASGTELRINAVAKTKTEEYPEGDCSPGAISAAFDSQRGVEGFEMVRDDKGVKTVRKL